MLKALQKLFSGPPSMSIEDYLDGYQGKKNHELIDVRTAKEFKSGHVNGAKNIPLNTINNNLKKIPKEKTVIVMCRTGNRSGMAARQLASAGYENVINLKGGVMRWQAMGEKLKR